MWINMCDIRWNKEETQNARCGGKKLASALNNGKNSIGPRKDDTIQSAKTNRMPSGKKNAKKTKIWDKREESEENIANNNCDIANSRTRRKSQLHFLLCHRLSRNRRFAQKALRTFSFWRSLSGRKILKWIF